MDRLEPIPSPPGHWWNLFCQRLLPVVVFGGAAAGVVVLWQFHGGGRMFVGMGQGAQASILAPQPGAVVEMLVQPFSEVRRGDPIAVFRGFDPRIEVDRLRLRLDLARLQSAPSLAESSAVDLERLRLELARTRSELATARVRLDFATREVDRLEPLFRERLIAEDAIELSRGTRDMNAAEVREKERLMEEVETRLRELELRQALAGKPMDGGAGDGAGDADGGMASLLAGTEPAERTLVAPIDGVVGPWLRQPGEFLVEGEPLLSIQGRVADRIVGYLRQPFGFDPQSGLAVQVMRRTLPRERFPSVIRHVGVQFEPITNALAVVRDGVLLDVGLPVVVEVPSDRRLRPGEMVDIVVRGVEGRLRRVPGGDRSPGFQPMNAAIQGGTR